MNWLDKYMKQCRWGQRDSPRMDQANGRGLQQNQNSLARGPGVGLAGCHKAVSPIHGQKESGSQKVRVTQTLRPWKRPMAYLSKKLDPVAMGWPPCLHIIAATALLVKDLDKLILGQALIATTAYAIEGVLRHLPDRWLTKASLIHYKVLLLTLPQVQFSTSSALNPATLLPDPDLDGPLHDCQEILCHLQGTRSDLGDSI